MHILDAHSLLVTFVMRDNSDFSHTNCLQISFFQQKIDVF